MYLWAAPQEERPGQAVDVLGEQQCRLEGQNLSVCWSSLGQQRWEGEHCVLVAVVRVGGRGARGMVLRVLCVPMRVSDISHPLSSGARVASASLALFSR